ncbi:MAG: 4-(cytidine 5'-diphospho)-2-C-methyl-D-erythritol kinase [Ruminococcus sp.]
MRVTALAPAKINLTLDIFSLRDDGYHEVSMIMQTVSLYETVTVTASKNSSPPKPDDNGEIIITCDREGVPCDSRNIAYKAAVEFFRYTGLTHGNITVGIQKKIPFGAGLAGGSADGAAVIVILNRIFDTHLSQKQMCEIGEKVGADVPFCIVGGTRHATGTGTTLKKLYPLPKCQIVICKPDISISTAEAYSLADKRTGGHYSYTQLCIPAIYSGSVRNVSDYLHNDFEEVLCLEEINRVKSVMYKNRALGSAMSGSGSAVFGIFLSKRNSNKCYEALKESYGEVFLTEPVSKGVVITDVDLSEE